MKPISQESGRLALRPASQRQLPRFYKRLRKRETKEAIFRYIDWQEDYVTRIDERDLRLHFLLISDQEM